MDNTLQNRNRKRLIYGSSETDADLLYAIKVMLPDDAIYLETEAETALIVGTFEVPRIKRCTPTGIKVYSYSEVLASATPSDRQIHSGKPKRSDAATAILSLTNQWNIDTWEVPSSFPLGLAEELQTDKIDLVTRKNFFPERARKKSDEIATIEHAVRLAESGMQRAWEIIADSTVSNRDKALVWQKEELTAEILQGEINATIALLGGTAEHTITAWGIQAADPHENGHGAIKAGQPVVIDIFPRENKRGYHGDLTRTVIKGRAPTSFKKAHTAVNEARKAAIEKVRAGIPARGIHYAAETVLETNDFFTDRGISPPSGFIHGIGHGLGLAVHEFPRVSSASDAILQTGNVITIEPGLYYPEWGGIRLEDVIVVENQGCRDLTTADIFLEIE